MSDQITLHISPALALNARERRQVADAAHEAAERKVAHILTMRRVLRRTAPAAATEPAEEPRHDA